MLRAKMAADWQADFERVSAGKPDAQMPASMLHGCHKPMIYAKADVPAWGGNRPSIGAGVNFVEELQRSLAAL